MAQHSYRFNPRFNRGSWWRLDISWRTSALDPHHFNDEWSTPFYIPLEPSDERTWFTVPEISFGTADEAEVIIYDQAKISIQSTTVIESFLSRSNESGEVRIWWSADGVTYECLFWGMVNYGDIGGKTYKIVEGEHLATRSFTVTDAMKKMDTIAFRDYTQLDNVPYLYTGAYASGWLYLANVDVMSIVDWSNSNTLAVCLPTVQLMNLKYFLEEIGKAAFDERYYQTVAADLAQYGHVPASPVDSVFDFVAQKDQNPLGGNYAYAQFDVTYMLFDAFSAELAGEFKNWGLFLRRLCDMLGFSVSTKFTIETNGGEPQVVRSLLYSRIAGGNGVSIVPQGGLLSHEWKGSKRGSRYVTATTRMSSGAIPCYDQTGGNKAGKETNLATYFRSLGAFQPLNYRGKDFWKKSNTMWQALVIEDGAVYRMVTGMKYTKGATTFQTPSPVVIAPTWDEPGCQYNAIAHCMAEYYAEAEWAASQHIVEEEYTGICASNGSTLSPAHWLPYAAMTDTEFTGVTFKLRGVTIQPNADENGRVKLTKEVA